MIQAGALNAWRCPHCQKLTVAIHVDAGVTPMMLACRATKGCNGMASSYGYPDQTNIPKSIVRELAWEWYKPTGKELRKLDAGTQHHVNAGGLLIRPLTEAGKKALLA